MALDRISREMSQEAIDEFLNSRGHGLLSLASQDRAYGIPIVYGYDPEGELFSMEFLFQEESKKQTFLTENEEASLCVYDWESMDSWQSVVATGELVHITDEERIAELMSLLAADNTDVAPWSLRSPLSDLQARAWYLLDPNTLNGYRAD